jgi:hypothetical protein
LHRQKRFAGLLWMLWDRNAESKSHRTGHWRSATYLKTAARAEAWEGRDPGSIRVLLSNPRWERRLLRFLELSGLGRIVEGGLDVEEAYAARMDEWVIWETKEERAGRASNLFPFFFSA